MFSRYNVMIDHIQETKKNNFIFVRWIHLLFTLIFNILVLGDVEMLIGWFPVSVIYLGSGFAGNIFGAIVIPYRPEVNQQYFMYRDP